MIPVILIIILIIGIYIGDYFRYRDERKIFEEIMKREREKQRKGG